MTKRSENKMRQAKRSLVKILEDVGPYIRRPVVKEYSTRGRWTQTESHDAEKKLPPVENKSLNDLFT